MKKTLLIILIAALLAASGAFAYAVSAGNTGPDERTRYADDAVDEKAMKCADGFSLFLSENYPDSLKAKDETGFRKGIAYDEIDRDLLLSGETDLAALTSHASYQDYFYMLDGTVDLFVRDENGTVRFLMMGATGVSGTYIAAVEALDRINPKLTYRVVQYGYEQFILVFDYKKHEYVIPFGYPKKPEDYSGIRSVSDLQELPDFLNELKESLESQDI